METLWSPRKIALVLHKFSRGGSDRVAAHLARGFTHHGIETEMLVLAQGGEIENILVQLVGDDIPIRYLGGAQGWRPADLVRGLPALVRHLKATRPDAVISTANNTALITALAVKLAGLTSTRLFLKTTNPIASSRHRGIVRRIRHASYHIIFRWTRSVWTLSLEEAEEMIEAFPKYSTLFRDVANPYVTEAMLDTRHDHMAVRERKTVLTIARLTHQKRLERLIEAFARIKTRPAKLVILGEGELRGELSRLVEARGLSGRVSMPGYLANVAPILHDADLFMLTSDYEGLPAAALEAMAANCPVLSTDCFPNARALLAKAEGCAIIEDVAPDALAAQIDAFLARPKPKGLQAVARRYSIAEGVKSHLDAMQFS